MIAHTLDYSECSELPPCVDCLVRATCGRHLVQKGSTCDLYLIVEFAEQCPMVVNYFGKFEDGRIKHNHEKIAKIARIHGAKNGEYFVWFANEIGIYTLAENTFK